ncbi:unnamed protein product [Brassica rapa subsp. trilocularis]
MVKRNKAAKSLVILHTLLAVTLSLPLNRMKKNLPWQNGLFEESNRVTGIEALTGMVS